MSSKKKLIKKACFVIAGGVAANKSIRKNLEEVSKNLILSRYFLS